MNSSVFISLSAAWEPTGHETDRQVLPPTNCFLFADTFVSRFSFLLQQRYLEAPGANQGIQVCTIHDTMVYSRTANNSWTPRLLPVIQYGWRAIHYSYTGTRYLVHFLNAAASCGIESGKRGGCDCWAAGSRPGLPARPPTNLAQTIRMHVPQQERQDCQDCSRGPIILWAWIQAPRHLQRLGNSSIIIVRFYESVFGTFRRRICRSLSCHSAPPGHAGSHTTWWYTDWVQSPHGIWDLGYFYFLIYLFITTLFVFWRHLDRVGWVRSSLPARWIRMYNKRTNHARKKFWLSHINQSRRLSPVSFPFFFAKIYVC